MPNDGFVTVRIPAKARPLIDRLVDKIDALGDQLPGGMRDDADGIGPATIGGAVTMACAALERVIDSHRARVRGEPGSDGE